MRPTLRQLEFLVAIADTGQFGLAADRLNVSQPSLSAQVAKTEADLGLRIFNRDRLGARPTSAGEEIVRRARFILHEVEDLRASVTGGGIFDGRLRLGILPSIGPYLLPGVVRRLHREHPSFRLIVREESTKDLQEGLRTGRLDMIISTPEDHPGTLQSPLFNERLWAAVALDDPLASELGAISPAHFAGRSLLTLGSAHRLSLMVMELAQKNGGYVSDEYEGTSLDAIRLMAAAGVGIAILPNIYASTEARRGTDIALRPIDDPAAQRTIALIQPNGHGPRPGSKELAGVLAAEARSLVSVSN